MIRILKWLIVGACLSSAAMAKAQCPKKTRKYLRKNLVSVDAPDDTRLLRPLLRRLEEAQARVFLLGETHHITQNRPLQGAVLRALHAKGFRWLVRERPVSEEAELSALLSKGDTAYFANRFPETGMQTFLALYRFGQENAPTDTAALSRKYRLWRARYAAEREFYWRLYRFNAALPDSAKIRIRCIDLSSDNLADAKMLLRLLQAAKAEPLARTLADALQRAERQSDNAAIYQAAAQLSQRLAQGEGRKALGARHPYALRLAQSLCGLGRPYHRQALLTDKDALARRERFLFGQFEQLLREERGNCMGVFGNAHLYRLKGFDHLTLAQRLRQTGTRTLTATTSYRVTNYVFNLKPRPLPKGQSERFVQFLASASSEKAANCAFDGRASAYALIDLAQKASPFKARQGVRFAFLVDDATMMYRFP